MSRNIVWIDTTSGTYGDVDGKNGRLVLVDLEAQAREDTLAGEAVDADSLDAFLVSAGDSEIADFGNSYGVQPVAGLSMEDLGKAVRMLLPEAQFEQDNDGQWIIYTGRRDES